MFSCSICGVSHERYRDKHKLRGASYCHACHAEHMRYTRPSHKDLPPDVKRRANARAYANVYLKRGKIIKPDNCSLCDNTEIEMHHKDYLKPLDIVWLCRPCHLREHC